MGIISRWILCYVAFLATYSPANGLSGVQWLFPEPRTYVLDLKAGMSTGSVLPANGSSQTTMYAQLYVRVNNETNVLFSLKDVKALVYYNNSTNKEVETYEQELISDAERLNTTWGANYMADTGMLYEVLFQEKEPIWSANIKRSLALTLQLVRVNSSGSMFKNSYPVVEPCIHNFCNVEYTGVGTNTVRKRHGVPTSDPGLGRSIWSSVSPDLCTKDIKEPFIGNAERVYKLDEFGIQSMDLTSVLDYHSHGHLLSVITSMSLYRDRMETNSPQEVAPTLLPAHWVYVTHSYQDPTNGRAQTSQKDLLEKSNTLLTRVSEKIDSINVTDKADAIHDTDIIMLHKTLSRLSFDNLKSLSNDLHVGTSYLNETNKNIFLEVLPHIKSAASARLVKYLVMDFTDFKIDEAAALSLIRKLPFNLKEYSRELLTHTEELLNLPPDSSREIRHASILSFATLAFNTYMNEGCSADDYEGYVQKYFRMYTECPKYEDRLVWLQGLGNLQVVGSVSRYLGPIIQDKKVSRHERFLAIWATMPLAPYEPELTSSLYWPILMDPTEHLQLRSAALLQLLGEQTPSRVLSLHRYIMGCGDGHLMNLWYTTVKDLKRSSYSCFSTISRMLSYVSGRLKEPASKFWATSNNILDLADQDRQYSAMGQLLTISKPLAGHPELMYFSLNSNQAGLTTSQISVMIKAEGLDNSLIHQVDGLKRRNFSTESIFEELKKMNVQFKKQQPVHIEVIVNVQGKTVYAVHIYKDETGWKNLDIPVLKTIYELLNTESHINQQFVQYPLQTEVDLPTELGMPATLKTTWSSFISVRGTMTTPKPKENDHIVWGRKNDLHLRYLGTAVTTLSSYFAVSNSDHAISIQQSTLSHLPLKFNLEMTKDKAQFSWLNTDPTGGVVTHSRTAVTTTTGDGRMSQYTVRVTDRAADGEQSEVLFDCERPLTTMDVLEKLLDSNRANYNFFSSPRPSLLLVHVLYLISLPSPGSCGVMLRSRFPFHLPAGTRVDVFAAHEDTHFKWWEGESGEDGAPAITNNRTSYFEIESSRDSSEGASKFEIMFRDLRNDTLWTLYISNEIKSNISNSRLLLDTPYEGTLVIEFARNHQRADDLKIIVDYLAETNGSERSFNTVISAVNNPQLTGLHLSKYLFANENTGLPREMFRTRVLLSERQGKVTLMAGDWFWSFNLGDQAALAKFLEILKLISLDQYMLKYGMIQECVVNDRNVVTFSGNDQLVMEDSKTLLLADCTEHPRFALYWLKDGYEFHHNGNRIVFPKKNWDEKNKKTLQVVRNNVNHVLQWIFEDLGGSGMFEVKINTDSSKLFIFASDAEMETYCGLCVGDHYINSDNA